MLLSKIVLTYLKGRKGNHPKQILFQTINSTCIVKNGLQIKKAPMATNSEMVIYRVERPVSITIFNWTKLTTKSWS
jgi:hypothetical protein